MMGLSHSKVMETLLAGHRVKVAAGLAAVLFLYSAWRRLTAHRLPLPPGPRGWPIIGYSKILNPNMYLDLADMKQRYGEVCSFYIGSRLTVALNGYKSIREAFINQGTAFAGRPYPWVMKLVDVKEEINNGTYTEEWKFERKFLLGAFRQFGYGSSSLDDKIAAEIARLMTSYERYERRPFDPRQHMSAAMANLIFSIMINESYELDDPALDEKIALIREWQESVGGANVLDLFPVLRFLPGWRPLAQLRRAKEKIVAVYRRHVDEHVRTFDPGHCRDVIDVYLRERGVDFDREKMIGLFFSVTGDAVDSLPETMVWMVLYLAAFPDIQSRIRREINSVTESHRKVELSDRPQMPFTEATIMECLRMSTFVPISEPHQLLEDAVLHGYRIPRGCNVLANIYSAHMDPEFWGDPTQFRPGRFLNSQGQVFKPAAYMPFSEGRRKCLAEQLAQKVMFSFTATVIQRFRVTFPDDRAAPSLQAVKWYNRKTCPFVVIANPITDYP